MSKTARDTAKDLAALVEAGQAQIEALALIGGKTLPAAVVRSGINATTGIGAITGSGGSGGGIASPLTELSAATRTYHDSTILESTDGIFSFVVENLHTIDLFDGTGSPVQIIYDNPA